MTPYIGKIVLIALLFAAGLWGLFASIRSSKSPPTEMRFFGLYLRIGLAVGSLACLVGAAWLLMGLITP